MKCFHAYTIAILTLCATGLVQAQKLGDHPAVVVQRLQAQAGYDYAAKFYPHPAWLYLAAEAPRPMNDHPAVTIARREQQRRAAEEAAAEARLAARH